MKKMTIYETFDGAQFFTEKDAAEHLEELRGNIICAMAQKLCTIDKYTATVMYLNECMNSNARKLVDILDDLKVENDEED